jgi:hypothetical protein
MLLLLPLAWLAVVVLVAGVTWRVIDSAGRQVLTSGGPAPLSSSGATPGAESSPSQPTGSRKHDSKSEGPAATKAPEPDGSPSPGAAGATQPTQQPSQQPPQTQVRSWQGAAGTVSAACTGATISLQSVTPSDGWGFEVDDRGPQRVRVEFTSRGEDEHETRVEAECAGGEPRFQVETKD